VISISVSGDTHNTERFLDRMMKGDLYSNLEPYAQRGVEALRAATPQETGLTADSWTCEVIVTSTSATIWWSNTHTESGFNVAIGLQYGHGTGTGGWIEGQDYINPALRAIFDEIADAVWKEVQKA
jgi:hypothetical protein